MVWSAPLHQVCLSWYPKHFINFYTVGNKLLPFKEIVLGQVFIFNNIALVQD